MTIAAVEAVGAFGAAPWARAPETALLDVGHRLRPVLAPAPPLDPRLVIVALDDRAAEYERRYTSDPDFYSALLATIAAAHPRLVFWDVVQNNPLIGTETREAFDALAGKIEGKGPLDEETRGILADVEARVDVGERLARALAAAPTVIPLPCDSLLMLPEGDPWKKALAKAWGAGAPPGWLQAEPLFRVSPSLGPLVDAAIADPISCEHPDEDGVLRRELGVVAFHGHDGVEMLPGAPLVLAAIILGTDHVVVEPGAIVVGPRRVPIDPGGGYLIDYAGPPGSWRSRARPGHPSEYSAADVLSGQVRPALLTDRIILVGSMRLSQRDAKETPFRGGNGGRMPGLERVATELDAILSARVPPRRPEWAGVIGFVATVLLGGASALLGGWLRPTRSFLLAPLAAMAVLAGALSAFLWGRVWIDGALPAAAALAPALVTAVLIYSAEQEEKRFLQEAFATYVAPEVVDSILRAGAVRVDGEPREMTILFADLRNFTRNSAAMPATRIVEMLNEHLTAMTDVILRHGGTLDKFIGDAVMAFWNAPTEDPQHARHACEAALEMIETLHRMNRVRAERGEPPQDMGVGIATGRVVVGAIGAEGRRFNYTAIGDPVNMASRFEGLTKNSEYGILVGDLTREAVGDALGFVELGAVPVKGREEGVTVFGVARSRRTS